MGLCVVQRLAGQRFRRRLPADTVEPLVQLIPDGSCLFIAERFALVSIEPAFTGLTLDTLDLLNEVEALLRQTTASLLLLCLQGFIEFALRMRQATNRDDIVTFGHAVITILAVALKEAVKVLQQPRGNAAAA